MSLCLENEPKRGRGLWKLNVSLLTDSQYAKLMKIVLKDAIKDSNNLVDVGLKRDYIKCRIRTESITFSINKQKNSRLAIDKLSKQLSELETKVSTTPTPDSVEEHYVVKNQLNSLYDDIAAGALIRSRCTHINEHEKPTSYFLNQEKLNGKSKHIRTLNFGGERISDPQKILDVQRQYFSKFYSQPAETEVNDTLYL